MTHQQAFAFCQKSINERIEEMGAAARVAREDGHDDRHAAARNFQNGLFECADLLEKMGMLVNISGGKESEDPRLSLASRNAATHAPGANEKPLK